MEICSQDFDLQLEVDSLLRRREARATGHFDADAIDDLQRLDRCVAHLEALRADLLVEAADLVPRVEEFTVESADGDIRRRPRTVVIEDAVREEIAAAMRWSPNHAGALIAEARQLHTYLPATREALRNGAISGRHAAVVAEWSGRLSGAGSDYEQSCAAFEEQVLRVARGGTVAQTRAAAKRALAALDSVGAQHRRDQARCTRDVRIVDEFDGISVLMARMSTPAARAVIEAVGHEATLIDDESLSAGERRAQALASLVFGAVAPQVRLDVLVPATGDLTEEAGPVIDALLAGIDVATIDGAQIDPRDIRDLIADPLVALTLRKLVADPVTGVLSGCGRTTYRAPQRLREFIVRRDGTCRFPGCGRSARRSQIDHASAWDEGGATDPENLGALCTRHHQLKTHGGWQLNDSRVDGSCTWVSPGGRRYRHRSESVLELTLQQQFAHVVASALSTNNSSGFRPGYLPGHEEYAPAIRIELEAAGRAYRREPDPPF